MGGGDRSVTVHLKADIGDYIAPIKEAIDKSKDLRGVVEELDGGLKVLGKAADSTGDEMRQLGTKTDQAGDNMRQTSRDAVGLAAALEVAKLRMRGLADEFQRTGNRSLLKDFRAAKSEVSTIESMIGSDGGSGGGGGGGRSAVSGILPGGANPGPQAIGVITAGIIAASPMIGAALNGVILGALGLGTIAVGIAAQFTNPRVKSAASGFATFLKLEIVDASSSFVAPLLSEFPLLAKNLRPVFADLKQDFGKLAPYVSSLFGGIAQFAQSIMPGLNKAFEAMGPVLQQITKDLPMLGAAISTFFDESSKGAKGATEGIHAMLLAISGFISGMGFVIRGLSNAFDFVVQQEDRFSGQMLKLTSVVGAFSPVAAGASVVIRKWHENMHDLATTYDRAKGVIDAVHDSFANLKDPFEGSAFAGKNFDRTVFGMNERLEGLNQTIDANIRELGTWQAMMNKINGAAILVEQSNEQLTLDIDRQSKAFQQHGASLDVSTVAGAENRAMIVGWIADANQAGEAARQNAIANGRQATASQEAAAATQNYINKMAAAAIAGGADAATVWSIINALNAIPKTTYTSLIVTTKYLEEGTRPGGLNNIRYFNAQGNVYYADGGLLSQANAWGPGRTIYGFREPSTGGEGFVPRFGDYRRSTSIIDEEARWYGGRFVPDSHVSGGGGGGMSTSPAAIADAIRRTLPRALSGLTVVLDGKAVGRIQGRHVDLLLRGG